MSILEQFAKETKNHQMTVLLDQGVYRHLRFAEPGTSSYSFDLITGPGYLLYRGDMGCYEFERLNDMFDFFRGKGINPGYWSEKVESISKHGSGIKAFSIETFRSIVEEQAKEFIENNEHLEKDWNDFNEEIESLIGSTETGQDAYQHITEWDIDGHSAQHVFGVDAWEFDFTEFTHHFLWCCHAMVWGIDQYDKRLLKAA